MIIKSGEKKYFIDDFNVDALVIIASLVDNFITDSGGVFEAEMPSRDFIDVVAKELDPDTVMITDSGLINKLDPVPLTKVLEEDRVAIAVEQ